MGKAELIQEIVENLARCQRPSMHSGLQNHGLSPAQMGMLYMIFYHREVSPKDIADNLGITKSAVTQLLDPLVEKDLVQRHNDPRDRRIIRLGITTKGKRLIRQWTKLKYAGIRSALDSLETQELERFNQLCQKMFANIKS